MLYARGQKHTVNALRAVRDSTKSSFSCFSKKSWDFSRYKLENTKLSLFILDGKNHKRTISEETRDIYSLIFWCWFTGSISSENFLLRFASSSFCFYDPQHSYNNYLKTIIILVTVQCNTNGPFCSEYLLNFSCVWCKCENKKGAKIIKKSNFRFSLYYTLTTRNLPVPGAQYKWKIYNSYFCSQVSLTP